MKLVINGEEFPIVIEELIWDNHYKTGAKANIKLGGYPNKGLDFDEYSGGEIIENDKVLFNNVMFLNSNYSSILLIKNNKKI